MIKSNFEYKPIGKLNMTVGELVMFDISAGDQEKAYGSDGAGSAGRGGVATAALCRGLPPVSAPPLRGHL
jgi:hypothetical protein